MFNLYLVILIILLLILYYFLNLYKYDCVEKYTPSQTISYIKGENKSIIADKVGWDKSDYNILNDPLFSNVVYHENDIDPITGNTVRLGLDKCLEYCKGNCVEYGITGNTYCFP